MPEVPPYVFVLDNGGYQAKAGFFTDGAPKLIPNCITKAKGERRRNYIGSQLDQIENYSGLYYRYPFERGYLLDWDIQKQVWDYIFGVTMFNVDFEETLLIVTEPYFNFLSIQEAMTEVLFEEYKFHSIVRTYPSNLSAYLQCRTDMTKFENSCLVVDSGFSFTHIVPIVKQRKVKDAIRRIDLGGKHLTNRLKEIISYRQLNVMDETYVVNQMKEDLCYVSNDLFADLKICRQRGKENTVVRDYVLPDYTDIKRGYVRSVEETNAKSKDADHQYIRMNNERFQVPEILFHPSDIDIAQMGISEAIVHCIKLCPEEVQPLLSRNILLTGGSAMFPGMKERVLKDVKSYSDDLYEINVIVPNNPITHAWEGGALFAKDPRLPRMILTRKLYQEFGVTSSLCQFRL